MIARYPRLEAICPVANAPVATQTAAVGQYTVTTLPDGSATVTIACKQHYFHSFDLAVEYLELFSEGKHDQSVPFASGGCSLIISGSTVKRAPQWVQDDAKELEIGDREFVWHFSFNHSYGADFCIFDTYEDAIAEVHRLVAREADEAKGLPF
jgi:hypothetical protein